MIDYAEIYTYLDKLDSDDKATMFKLDNFTTHNKKCNGLLLALLYYLSNRNHHMNESIFFVQALIKLCLDESKHVEKEQIEQFLNEYITSESTSSLNISSHLREQVEPPMNALLRQCKEGMAINKINLISILGKVYQMIFDDLFINNRYLERGVPQSFINYIKHRSNNTDTVSAESSIGEEVLAIENSISTQKRMNITPNKRESIFLQNRHMLARNSLARVKKAKPNEEKEDDNHTIGHRIEGKIKSHIYAGA